MHASPGPYIWASHLCTRHRLASRKDPDSVRPEDLTLFSPAQASRLTVSLLEGSRLFLWTLEVPAASQGSWSEWNPPWQACVKRLFPSDRTSNFSAWECPVLPLGLSTQGPWDFQAAATLPGSPFAWPPSPTGGPGALGDISAGLGPSASPTPEPSHPSMRCLQEFS